MGPPTGRQARHALVLALLVAAVQASAAGEEVRSVPTRKGVTQGFLLVRLPRTPTASLILFAGGDGRLALSSPNTINQLKFNFLVKMRERFANAGSCEAQAQHGYLGIEREAVDAIV